MESIRLAKDCLNTALARDDVDREEVLLNLGLAARWAGEYDDVVRFAKKALQIDPDYRSAKELLTSIDGAIQAQDVANRLGLQRRSDL
jgi:tetratricopeptide (TPR) repeat protein